MLQRKCNNSFFRNCPVLETFPKVQSFGGFNEPQNIKVGFSLEPKTKKLLWSVLLSIARLKYLFEKLKTQMQCIIQRKVLIP